MQPFSAKVGLEVMAMKECSAFSKAPDCKTPPNECPGYDTRREGSNSSEEVQSMYSTAPTDWEIYFWKSPHKYLKKERKIIQN